MNKPKIQMCAALMLAMICSTVLSAEPFRMSEKSIRDRVIKRKMPRFPKEAFYSGAHGVVIVAVLFDEEGSLSKFEIMEAPHPSIKQAVSRAIKKWKVRPSGNREGPVKIAGWLSFDYVIEEGVRRVRYTTRTADDYQQDKRYIHPFYSSDGPFYYQYIWPPAGRVSGDTLD